MIVAEVTIGMKVIQLITAVLIVFNALFGIYCAFFHRKQAEPSSESKKLTRKQESSKQESFYRNYYEITSSIACILLGVIVVALIWTGFSFRFLSNQRFPVPGQLF